MERKRVTLENLRDASGEEKVRQTLLDVWGIVQVEDVKASTGEVRFTYDERAASFGDFTQALEEVGFPLLGGEENGNRM